MNKKEYIEIAGIKIEKNNKYILPKDADEFTRASWLIMGRIKPETESEERLVKEAKEMMDKGITVEIPFN